MSKHLTWTWFDDNSACWATAKDIYYRRKWEMVVEPTATKRNPEHYARRGPFRIEVLTCTLDDDVLSTRKGTKRYPNITKARAAAVRLMRRVRQQEHEARRRGGQNDDGNLRLTCISCNCSKGAS